jgi:superfamily II DNA helicase RecQ
VVAHDRSLRELVRQRPRDAPPRSQQVPGFGPQKTERFGPTFLEVIAAHPSA